MLFSFIGTVNRRSRFTRMWLREIEVATRRQMELEEALRRALAEFGDSTPTDFLIAVTSDRTQTDPRDVIKAVEAVHHSKP